MTVIEQETSIPHSKDIPQTKSQHPLRYRVENDFSKLTSFRHEWDRAAERLGATIYMSYDWCLNWWDYYGKGHDLRIFFFYQGEEIVAILPLYITTFKFGLFNCRVARLVGSNVPPKVFNPPVHPEYAKEILLELATRIFSEEDCVLLSLGYISELYGNGLLEGVNASKTNEWRSEIHDTDVHSVFHLPPDFQQYLEMLSKNERKRNKNRYDLSLIQAQLGGKESIVSDLELVDREFSSFATLHAEQWRARGGTGHFKSWPKAEEFNSTVIQAMTKRSRTEFVNIEIPGEKIAQLYGYHFGKVFFAEYLARSLNPDWDTYNLGRTIVVRAVAQAISRGATLFDAGLGHYDYKERLKAKEYKVHTVHFIPRSFSKRLKIKLLKVIQNILKLLYHKIWYRRLRKHLPPAKRKPISLLWTKFDF